ncbi:MAG: UvrD-helicase domain-containing protein [Gemmatimonadota bacterium]
MNSTTHPTDSSYLEGLNPQQAEAVHHFEGPALVLAGAGSGKTRVLTARLVHLIQHHGVSPERLLSVTFTNKAAGEMRRRTAGMLGSAPRGMWIGTFHSMGARLLRRHADALGWSRAFTIYDADAALRLVKETQKQVGVDPKRWNPKGVRGAISDAKNRLISPEAYLQEFGDSFDLMARMVARVYPEYQASLRRQNAMDFDDLLVKPVELFLRDEPLLRSYQDRFAFLLVDEYQDTNRAQFRFLELLGKAHGNLMVVGDDDQSIYGWRGADLRNILDFEETFPGARVVRLEENYRSTVTILEAANAVIQRNVHRKGKTLRTQRETGQRLTLTECADEADEASWISQAIQEAQQSDPGLALRDFAILYRTNAQSRALEDAFRRGGIPYQIIGGVRFYERREIQDLLAYLRLISNPLDRQAFQRVVNVPRRGVGATSLERLESWMAAAGIPPMEGAARATEAPGLSSSAVRGLEAFAALIQRFSGLAAQHAVGEVVEALVGELELLRHLREEGPEGDDRADNVKELIAGAMDFQARQEVELEEGEGDGFTELDIFLQQVALVADVDRHDPEADQVTFMTLHNAKGLEFPTVFISGLEDGLFPLGRAYEEPAELEEERRLFYVGITRAQDRLHMTYARQRRRGGEYMAGRLSSFVDEIPGELVEVGRTQRLSRNWASYPGTSSRAGGRRDESASNFGGGREWVLDPEPEHDADAGMDQDRPRFTKGEPVLHPTFGSGVVEEVSGFGPDLKVTVRFQKAGRKKLLARYADLRRDFP